MVVLFGEDVFGGPRFPRAIRRDSCRRSKYDGGGSSACGECDGGDVDRRGGGNGDSDGNRDFGTCRARTVIQYAQTIDQAVSYTQTLE